MTNSDIVEKVTADILAELAAGVAPWRQPWKGGGAVNVVSGKAYRGINVWVLWAAARRRELHGGGWLTFKQAQALGGSVRKGEKGTAVVFWRLLQDRENSDRTVPLLRHYTVFHASQCDGLPESLTATPGTAGTITDAEALIALYADRPAVLTGDAAYYTPARDTVTLPSKDRFESLTAYYHTLYHELAHSTGHVSRLKRAEVIQPERFGSHAYGVEELTAEMTAAFACARAGLAADTLQPSASYLKSWLGVLRAEPKMLITAAARAQKAFDYMTGATAAAESVDE